MILTVDQQKEFEKVTRPVIKWLNDNCHPHCNISVDTCHAEVSEGVAAFSTEDYVLD